VCAAATAKPIVITGPAGDEDDGGFVFRMAAASRKALGGATIVRPKKARAASAGAVRRHVSSVPTLALDSSTSRGGATSTSRGGGALTSLRQSDSATTLQSPTPRRWFDASPSAHTTARASTRRSSSDVAGLNRDMVNVLRDSVATVVHPGVPCTPTVSDADTRTRAKATVKTLVNAYASQVLQRTGFVKGDIVRSPVRDASVTGASIASFATAATGTTAGVANGASTADATGRASDDPRLTITVGNETIRLTDVMVSGRVLCPCNGRGVGLIDVDGLWCACALNRRCETASPSRRHWRSRTRSSCWRRKRCS
jgi:hypothetical protein